MKTFTNTSFDSVTGKALTMTYRAPLENKIDKALSKANALGKGRTMTLVDRPHSVMGVDELRAVIKAGMPDSCRLSAARLRLRDEALLALSEMCTRLLRANVIDALEAEEQ